jgi:hypothetical protein
MMHICPLLSITRVAATIALVVALTVSPATAQIELSCVSGDCVNGAGIAESTDANSRYDGAWRSGLPHGTGQSWTANTMYEGEFRNGVPHGTGTLSQSHGSSSWTGEFVSGRPSGRGTYRMEGRVKAEDTAETWSAEEHVVNDNMHQVNASPPSDPAILTAALEMYGKIYEHAVDDVQDLDGALETIARLERLMDRLTVHERSWLNIDLAPFRMIISMRAGEDGRYLTAAQLAEKAAPHLYGDERLQAEYYWGMSVASHGYSISISAQNEGDLAGMHQARLLMEKSLTILNRVNHEDVRPARDGVTYDLAHAVGVHGHLLGRNAVNDEDQAGLKEAVALMEESLTIIEGLAHEDAERLRADINHDIARFTASLGHFRAQEANAARDQEAMHDATRLFEESLSILDRVNHDDDVESTRSQVTFELARAIAFRGLITGEDAGSRMDLAGLQEAVGFLRDALEVLDGVDHEYVSSFRENIQYEVARVLALHGHVRAQVAKESRDLRELREAVAEMKEALTILDGIGNEAMEPTRAEIRHHINQYESLLR